MLRSSGDRVEQVADAVPLARALCAGASAAGGHLAHAGGAGLHRSHRSEVPDAVVGAGTVRSAADAQAAAMAGARFAVSPGYTSRVGGPAMSSACRCCRAWPPAARSWRHRKRLHRTQILPGDAGRRPAMLRPGAGRSATATFCPTRRRHRGQRRGLPGPANVECVGGSWLTPADAVAAGDWARITALARACAGLRANRPFAPAW